MDVMDILEKGSLYAVIAVFLFGLLGTSEDMGGAEVMVRNALDDPQNYGVGMILYGIGFDIWIPAYSVESFGIFSPVMSLLYFYSGGFVPSYSTWCFVAALVVAAATIAIVWIFCDWSFWVKVAVGFVVGVITYYLHQFFGWLMIGWGGDMLGIDAYAMWGSSITATQHPLLFWFLLLMIPVSIFAVVSKLGNRLF